MPRLAGSLYSSQKNGANLSLPPPSPIYISNERLGNKHKAQVGCPGGFTPKGCCRMRPQAVPCRSPLVWWLWECHCGTRCLPAGWLHHPWGWDAQWEWGCCLVAAGTSCSLGTVSLCCTLTGLFSPPSVCVLPIRETAVLVAGDVLSCLGHSCFAEL